MVYCYISQQKEGEHVLTKDKNIEEKKKGRVAMPLAQQKFYTVEDIYSLPEGQRAELIDGQMYMMAPPTRTHQRIIGALYRKIADYIDSHKGACEVNIAPFAVFLLKDNLNYVEPDITIVCDPQKLSDKGCTGAPDWVIEVVSPGSRSMDYYTKLFRYQTAGVREYWIVDHDKRRITVWDFEHSATEDHSFSDTVKAGIYEDFSIDFSQLASEIF